MPCSSGCRCGLVRRNRQQIPLYPLGSEGRGTVLTDWATNDSRNSGRLYRVFVRHSFRAMPDILSKSPTNMVSALIPTRKASSTSKRSMMPPGTCVYNRSADVLHGAIRNIEDCR